MSIANRIAEADQLQQEIDRHRPLEGPALKRLRESWRIRLTWASIALEGNSLTEEEVRAVIEDGLVIGGKPRKNQLEAIGHAEAFDYLLKIPGRPEIAERDIRKLHRLLFIRSDPANAGHYRKRPVAFAGSDFVFPAPGKLKERMAAFIGEIPRLRTERHPIEFAALLHTRLVSIHPFADGNGRTARLLMNLPLLRAGYPVTGIPPALRSEYLAAIREGDAGNVTPFLDLLSAMVVENQRRHLQTLQGLESE